MSEDFTMLVDADATLQEAAEVSLAVLDCFRQLQSVRKLCVNSRTFGAPGTVDARVPQRSLSRCSERRRYRRRPCDRKRHIEISLRRGCADRPHHMRGMFGKCLADRRQMAKHGFPLPDIRSAASPADMSKG